MCSIIRWSIVVTLLVQSVHSTEIKNGQLLYSEQEIGECEATILRSINLREFSERLRSWARNNELSINYSIWRFTVLCRRLSFCVGNRQLLGNCGSLSHDDGHWGSCRTCLSNVSLEILRSNSSYSPIQKLFLMSQFM